MHTSAESPRSTQHTFLSPDAQRKLVNDEVALEIKNVVAAILNLRRQIVANNKAGSIYESHPELVVLYNRLHDLRSSFLLLPNNTNNPIEDIPLIEIREEDSRLFIGQRYILHQPPIATGSTGTIFRAVDQKILGIDNKPRIVVVKMIKAMGGVPDRSTIAQLIAEARTQAWLSSSGQEGRFVPVIDILKDLQNNVWFIMEYDERYIDVSKLARIIVQSEQNPESKRNFIKNIITTSALAVQRAYEFTEHRDIKPSNFLADSTGDAKLIDFGIASTVVETHDSFGSAPYMSLHRLHGNKENYEEDDIYALAAVYFELIAGIRHLNSSGSISDISDELKLLQSNIPIFDTHTGKFGRSLWFERADMLRGNLKKLGISDKNCEMILLIFQKAFAIREYSGKKSEQISEIIQPRQIEWASVSDFAKELAELVG